MEHKELYEKGILDTTSGKEPKNFGSPAPDPETRGDGQHKDYWVLSKTERAKGFVRPVRSSYIHTGSPGPKYELRNLTDEERRTFGADWVKYEPFPKDSGERGNGRLWTQEDLDKVGNGCKTVTSMGQALAETYARDPYFYGATFCVRCGKHFPVGAQGEFIWDDGSGERVGT